MRDSISRETPKRVRFRAKQSVKGGDEMRGSLGSPEPKLETGDGTQSRDPPNFTITPTCLFLPGLTKLLLLY